MEQDFAVHNTKKISTLTSRKNIGHGVSTQLEHKKIVPEIKTFWAAGSGKGFSNESIATTRSARGASGGTPMRVKACSKSASEAVVSMFLQRNLRKTSWQEG